MMMSLTEPQRVCVCLRGSAAKTFFSRRKTPTGAGRKIVSHRVRKESSELSKAAFLSHPEWPSNVVNASFCNRIQGGKEAG
jgi:hypothetical protein